MRTRRAREDDYEAVAAFTRDTWPDREGSDYIPDIYHEWIAGDGPTQRTFVLDPGDTDDLAGIAQAVMLSEYEAWLQGMRINPAYRGEGLATRLTREAFDWARERGATVARNMIFSWNGVSLGLSRTAGFDPGTEFRWVHPEPAADAAPSLTIAGDPDAAWSFWTGSEAAARLRGLALDDEESWAVSSLTRERLHDAADDDRLFVVRDGGTRAFTYRNRTDTRETDENDPVTWAEYAVAAWTDQAALESLLDAVASDAADAGADRTRVLVPETVAHVSDAAVARAEIAEMPTFVMAADLTDVGETAPDGEN